MRTSACADDSPHEAGLWSGEQRDTHEVADQAVINTLLGRRKMDIMEKRGTMNVKEFEDDDT